MSESKKVWRIESKDSGKVNFVIASTKTAAIHYLMKITVATGIQIADAAAAGTKIQQAE